MFRRLRRKLRSVRRYPEIGDTAEDRRDLWLFGLVRNRFLRPSLAARFTRSHSTCISPRLRSTRGQRVSLDFVHSGQVDCFDELFFDGIYALESVPFAPDLVADCGAYTGYFTAMAAGFFPSARRACWEANPDNLPMLAAQLALLEGDTELHAAAAYLREGVISFSGAGVGGAVREDPGENSAARQIRCEDFPAWLRAALPQRFVWKLDVEGAETELLPATLPFLPQQTVCFLETHHPDSVCVALLDAYRAAGFSVHEVRRRSAAPQAFDYVEWRLMRT